jgi:hypothetical protein
VTRRNLGRSRGFGPTTAHVTGEEASRGPRSRRLGGLTTISWLHFKSPLRIGSTLLMRAAPVMARCTHHDGTGLGKFSSAVPIDPVPSPLESPNPSAVERRRAYHQLNRTSRYPDDPQKAVTAGRWPERTSPRYASSVHPRARRGDSQVLLG